MKVWQEETIDGKTVVRVGEGKAEFRGWVDEKGFFVKGEFEKWLSGVVPFVRDGEKSGSELKGEGSVAPGVKDVEGDFGASGVEGKGSVRGRKKRGGE